MSGLEEFAPTTETELARFVAENAAGPRRALFPVGGRTALMGGPTTGRTPGGTPRDATTGGVVIPTSGLAGVVDYPARDMTITVGAGIRIDELVRRLAAEGQRLPVDVPQSQRATLGGVIATNASGPRRFGLGTIRDHLIGIAAVDGTGRLFHAGGRVVKNVAGYDLCKMLVGSRGTLAILSTVTLKLRPRPAAAAIVWAALPNLAIVESALERLVTSATRPVAIDVLSPGAAASIATLADPRLRGDRPVLVVGFEGTAPEIDWQSRTVVSELAEVHAADAPTIVTDRATPLFDALTDFQTRSEEALVFKANLRPSRTIDFVARAVAAGFHVQAHAANGIVYGHSGDVASAARAAALLGELRVLARASSGNVVVHDCEPTWREALDLDGDPEPSWPLMRRLAATLDPHGLFNPTRCPAWGAAGTGRADREATAR